jgi:hypothetical protein
LLTLPLALSAKTVLPILNLAAGALAFWMPPPTNSAPLPEKVE